MALQTIRQTLEGFGLSTNEVAVYLLLLKLGSSAASRIADHADMPRSTAQFTCQQLTKQGLLRMVKKANSYIFTAEPPEKLELLIQRQQEELQEKEERLHRIIGDLKAMQNPYSIAPKVQFFEGEGSLRSVYEAFSKNIETKEAVQSFISFMDAEVMPEALQKAISWFDQECSKRDLTFRIIAPESPTSLAYKKGASSQDEIRLTTSRNLPPGELHITKNALYFATLELEKEFGFIIESASICGMQSTMFDLLWDALSPQ